MAKERPWRKNRLYFSFDSSYNVAAAPEPLPQSLIAPMFISPTKLVAYAKEHSGEYRYIYDSLAQAHGLEFVDEQHVTLFLLKNTK